MNRKPQEATGAIMEEVDYVNTPASTVVKAAATSDQKSPSCTQSIPPLAVCWAILLVIMSLRIYFTSVMSENNAKLTAEVLKLKTHLQYDNITSLMSQVKHLETQNRQVKKEKNALTARVQYLETLWEKVNISQAQLSVELYCPITKGERKCNPCLYQWSPKPPNCYAVNAGVAPNLRTWDSAQERCTEINSDLVVIANEQEKTSVGELIGPSIVNKEFWIGLRTDNGKWKWLDGSELTNNSWVEQPPNDGQCALFHKDKKWRSVNCNEKHQWICQQKALTLT